MEIEEVIKIAGVLKNIAVFEYLTPEELEQVINKAELVWFKKGKVILEQGKTCRTFHLIIKGKVSVWVYRKFCSKVLIAYLGKDEYFGEMSLVFDDAITNTILAEEDIEAFKLTRRNLKLLYAENPVIQQKMEKVKAEWSPENDVLTVSNDLKTVYQKCWLWHRFKLFIGLS